jgi:glycerophosphoryl diester phosphodiesterase
VKVIAHRGEHREHPENTLPAYGAAIDLGCDYLEVDVRTTADGALVAMHDDTVDDRTNGRGRVEDMTLAEIRKLDAGVKFHERFRGTRVPVFDEVLALARNRIEVYVDAKRVTAPDLVAALRRHGLERHSVVYGALPLLAAIVKLAPEIRVMPEAVSEAVLRESLARLRPRVIAFDARDFRDEVIRIARAAGAGVFVDRLGPDDNEGSWKDAIARGATGIQTDRPADLLAFLRRRLP